MVINTVKNNRNKTTNALETDRKFDNYVTSQLLQVLREEIAYCYLKSLITLNICPSFPMIYSVFNKSAINKENYVFLMERGDGTMNNWVDQHTPQEGEFFVAIFQVMCAIVAMGLHLNVINNDMYWKNILYKSQYTPMVMAYQFLGRKWCIRTNYLFMVSDFGICSSPTLNQSHDMKNFRYHPRPLKDFLNMDYNVHVLEYNLPPFARDTLVFLQSARRNCPRHYNTTLQWISRAIVSLQYFCAAEDFHQPYALCKFFCNIFDKSFLRKTKLQSFVQHSGVPSQIYTMDQTSQTKQNIESATRNTCNY